MSFLLKNPLVVTSSLMFVLVYTYWHWLWGPCWSPLATECFVSTLKGDYVQHYYTWLMYAKNTDIDVIPPAIKNWTWPIEHPLLFGDPVPWAAIVFRPIYRLIEIDFQYFSILSLFNMLVTASCGILIGQRFLSRKIEWAFLAVLLVMSPPAILRLKGHEALSFHSIVILAITILVLRVRDIRVWCLVIVMALGTHAYYFPMVATLLILATWMIWKMDEHHQSNGENSGKTNSIFKIQKNNLPSGIAIIVFTTVLSLYVFGYIPNTADTAPRGVVWSANIFALLDPQEHSAIFDPIKIVLPYQLGGFSYLGLLGILMIVMALTTRMYKSLYPPTPAIAGQGDIKGQVIFPTPHFYWLAVFGMYVFSLGDTWYAKEVEVFKLRPDIPVLDFLFSTFRATSRFIWPLYYSLIIWAYITVAGSFQRSGILILLALPLLFETHVPTSLYVKDRLATRYEMGIEKIANPDSSDFVKLLKSNELLLNATGKWWFLSERISRHLIPSSNQRMFSNYRPWIARYPGREFKISNDGDGCEIAERGIQQAIDHGIQDILIIGHKEVLPNCGIENLQYALRLPEEGINIYSLKITDQEKKDD